MQLPLSISLSPFLRLGSPKNIATVNFHKRRKQLSTQRPQRAGSRPPLPRARNPRQPLARGPCPQFPAAGLPPGPQGAGRALPARGTAGCPPRRLPDGHHRRSQPNRCLLLAVPSLGSPEPRGVLLLFSRRRAPVSRSRELPAPRRDTAGLTGAPGEASNRPWPGPALPCVHGGGDPSLRGTCALCRGAIARCGRGRGRMRRRAPAPRGPGRRRRPLRSCRLAPTAGPEAGRAGAVPRVSAEQRLRGGGTGWHGRPAPEEMLCPGPEDGDVRPSPAGRTSLLADVLPRGELTQHSPKPAAFSRSSQPAAR